ncbi:MAG: hypothetical protein ACE5I1_02655, partial [bacterium]
LPSFQYMRDIILDPDGQKFALTGYATLTSVNDLKNEDYTGTSTIRIFTNNGESYRESEFDIDLAQDTYASVEEKKTVRDIAVQEHEAKRKYTTEPPKPGVPEVIDRIMIRDPGAYNSVDEYHNVLYNPGKNNESGPFACPGMANCRIAAFQDFVSASNNKRIFRYVSNNKADIYKPEKLLHVRNYYCSSSNLDQDVLKKVKPGLSSYYARIFCCCSVENDYGMIAMVLNHLIFRNFEKIVEPENKNDDWAISVQYLKDETCHNRYFSLNRVFGKVIKNPKFNEFNPNKPPMHLLRILPIGSPESARLWYIYAKSIYGFFKEIFQDYSYIFKWINQNRASRSFDQEPDFSSKSSGEYPIVYIIKKLTDDIEQVDFCKLCKTQPSEFDCRNLRAWV